MEVPEFETLAVSMVDQVALVELDRPEKANAMSGKMWGEIRQCFEWIDQEASIRIAVLAGKGKHFCAGIDLSAFSGVFDGGNDMDPARRSEGVRSKVLEMQEDLTAIEQCRKPVLGAIHSACIGAGVDMSCCLDMRYCAEDAYFCVKEIDLGMAADMGTLQRMPHLVGQGLVNELALTGRSMDANEAFERGFVNRVFPDRDQLIVEVIEIAQTIASKSPIAVRGVKESLLFARDHSVGESLKQIAGYNASMLSFKDLMLSMSAGGGTPEFEN